MASASTSYTERNNGTMRHHIGRMRRMVYAFSRKLDHHRAAVALNYAWYNFACVVRTLRVSPAMAAGLTDHLWSPEEFMDAVLSEEPNEAPTAKPLRLRPPKGTARELPEGRGFLRVVQGGKSPGPEPTPGATPVPVAPAMGPPTAHADDRQLSLLAFRPHPAKPSPPKGTELSLFDEPET